MLKIKDIPTLNTAFEYANNTLRFICYFGTDGEHKSEDLDKFKFEVNEHCLAKVGLGLLLTGLASGLLQIWRCKIWYKGSILWFKVI